MGYEKYQTNIPNIPDDITSENLISFSRKLEEEFELIKYYVDEIYGWGNLEDDDTLLIILKRESGASTTIHWKVSFINEKDAWYLTELLSYILLDGDVDENLQLFFKLN